MKRHSRTQSLFADSEIPIVNASIVRIELRQLFGEYNYDISVPPKDPSAPGLLILYGDNGSGKTTLLKLLVHLFSPEPYAGHRTEIGSVQFSSFTVLLNSGLVVSAERHADDLRGPYKLTIADGARTICEYRWTPEPHDDEDDRAYEVYCNAIRNCGFSIHFLSDSRKVLSFQRGRKRRSSQFYASDISRMVTASGEWLNGEEPEESWLQIAIRTAVQSVRSLTLAGTNRGFETANEIYRQIVARVVSATDAPDLDAEDARQRLRERLAIVCEQNRAYAKWGLTPTLETSDLEMLLGKAPPESLHLLHRILTPYLDGIQARLEALKEAQGIVSSFSSLMTEFYNRKKVRLHVSEGITITTGNGQELKPEDLSSGEQQLMLLMCNAISARRSAAVFAIDEPELSLNVKWQRKLVEGLLGMLRGTSCQLLLATHSMELLSKYRRNVVQLLEQSDATNEN